MPARQSRGGGTELLRQRAAKIDDCPRQNPAYRFTHFKEHQIALIRCTVNGADRYQAPLSFALFFWKMIVSYKVKTCMSAQFFALRKRATATRNVCRARFFVILLCFGRYSGARGKKTQIYILYIGFCQQQAALKSLQKLTHFLVQKLKGCNENKKKVSKF